MEKSGIFDNDTSRNNPPQDIARKMAILFEKQTVGPDKHYKDACAWYGSLKIAGLLDDESLISALADKYLEFRASFGELLAGEGHVDNNVFGIVPLEIYMQNGDRGCLAEGLRLAEHQYNNIKSQIRYAIDDMFMITGLQVQAFRASGEAKYLDLAAKTMADYLDKLQQTDGLFFHHPDFPHKWGRGNGWVAAGMAELLPLLPEESPFCEAVGQGFRLMLDGLIKYQIREGNGKGLWKQILDSDDPRNWAETSGSAMFCFALLSGIKSGFLKNDIYIESAGAAWEGLCSRVNDEGKLQDVSNWAYKPFSHPESGDRYDNDEENYYFEREKLTGDNHGQAPMLWSAAVLLS